MRFQIEFQLPSPGAYLARCLETPDTSPERWALLGEHMIMSVQAAPARDRKDVFAFRLDLDPDADAPKAGDVLTLTLADG